MQINTSLSYRLYMRELAKPRFIRRASHGRPPLPSEFNFSGDNYLPPKCSEEDQEQMAMTVLGYIDLHRNLFDMEEFER